MKHILLHLSVWNVLVVGHVTNIWLSDLLALVWNYSWNNLFILQTEKVKNSQIPASEFTVYLSHTSDSTKL